jgi:hypothetical protein
MAVEAEEKPIVDHDGGHGEPTREAEDLSARLSISSHIAHVHGGAARLEKGQSGLAVGIAFHGEEEHALHEASTIAPPRSGRLTMAKHLC